MSNPTLAHDLALKRTVHTPVDQKPHFAWRDLLAAESVPVPHVVLLCPHGEERFDLTEVADTLGKALTNVCLARGEKDIFNDANRAWVVRLCREVAANLTALARASAPLRLSLNALYELIEKTLVDNNAYFVAKSLLLNRARKISIDREAAAHATLRVIRRNNQVVPWSDQKVEIAVRKTFLSLQRDSAPAVAITKAVSERVHSSKQSFVHIEEIQDMVQEELMKTGHYKVAEAYILFRADRANARDTGADSATPFDSSAPAADSAPEQASMIVVKHTDGTNVFWDGADLRKRIEFARIGLDLCLTNDEIEAELRRSVYDQISQKDLDATVILNSKTLIERDADFAKFAGRIQLTYIYEEVLGWDIMRDGIGALKTAHQRAFRKYLEHGVAIKRLNPRLLDYDLARLAAVFDPSSDLEFDFLGIQTLYDRYLIIDKTSKPSRRIETPQFFWMRVAMGLFLDEPADREGKAAALYDLYKSRRFCSSTPTLFNSGTLHSQLSSCYLYYVDDSIEGIMLRGIAENAFLSKWAGGLGGSWTAVRGTGAYIGGTNGESQGVIPFLKLHNDQLVAVNQGGKRKGSGCAYLETWHNDILEFLELRKNTGDDRRRTHDMNTANWIPDLFMKRMEARQSWTLFRSNETPDLHELYGRKFEEAYLRYEKLAEQGKIHGHKIEALDLWKKMLSMLFETGHPWITFKDACNIRSPQDHVGVIHSSNLCCMTADQRVVTSEGLVTVGELYARARRAAFVGPDGNSVLTTEPVNTVVGRSGPVPAGPMLLPRPDAPIVRIITKEGYTHKVTPDHKVWVVGRGWVEAQELKRGDQIEIQQAEGLWGSARAEDLAFLSGLIAGDGTFMVREGTASVMLDVWAQEFGLTGEIEQCVARVLAAHDAEAQTTSSLTPRFAGDEYKRRLTSAPLARVLAARGFTRDTKLAVPEFVWTGTRETAAAYLRGLYAADATVEASGEVTTSSLASVSRDFLSQIQILLANFGIKSSLTKMRDAGLTALPDGRGGEREYWQAELFRLHVTSIQGCRLLENLTGLGALRQNARFLANLEKPGYAQKMHATFEALEPLPNEDAFCLQVFTEEHSWTVNGLITKNTEITLNTSNDETAVCNLGSVILDAHLLPTGEIDHAKLRETIRTAVRALDNVIDINFYPTAAAKLSNHRHRPIGLGVMGLAHALYLRGNAFASDAAVEFNDEAMEAIAFYAYEASSDLAAERGTYSTYKGSKWDRGLLPQDTLDLLEQERGVQVEVPRGGRMDWAPVRAKIAQHGMRNSNVLAIAPTATISNITATSPCIEPTYKNLFVKSNLSGEFIVLNPFLVKDLKARGLWDQDMIDSLKYFDGELKDIDRIPADLKARYLTAFDIDAKWIIDAAARRQKWIDQAQSVNLWIKTPDLKTLSHMYRQAWHVGLKTTYYLRSLGASNIEKATIAVKKEVRGAIKEGQDGGQNSGDAGGSHSVEAMAVGTAAAAVLGAGSAGPFASTNAELQTPNPERSSSASAPKKTYTAAEKTACSIEARKRGEECEACQ
jgi:ribonucleotide reductase alpha subunit